MTIDVTRLDYIDFPMGWEIARSLPMGAHHPKCSFRQTDGGILCDCDALENEWRKLRIIAGADPKFGQRMT